MKILAVDDQSENRYFLSTLLNALGHDVATAANGREALDKLKAGPFDLVVSDILMPVMDGFQLCRQVRQDEALRRILFVFYTATYVEDDDETFALRLGADRFLRKPMDPEDFVREIQDLARQAAGRKEIAAQEEDDDAEVLKLYNARLVKKLEDKMLRLEREITERNRLTAAVQQAAEAVVIMDSERNIEYVNPAFESITGFSSRETVGRPPDLAKMGVCDEQAYQNMWRTANQEGVWKGQLKDRSKEGKPIQWAVTTAPLRDPSGIVNGYVAVMRDVTVEELLKASLFQSQKMESIGKLASGIAHDFNNILSAIIGNAEMAVSYLHSDSSLAEVSLQHILDAADRAAGLVRQILTFSRRREPEMTLVSLTAVVKETVRLLRASFPSTIDIRLHLPEHSSLVVADIGQMHQVVMNLCTNAAHAMSPEGGVLTLTIDEESPSQPGGAVGEEEAYSECFLHLCVKDTGCGMSQEILDNIFEPYFTTKPPGKGTGLGLAVVHGIVTALKGRITVESVKGRGSAFHVYLPSTDLDEEPSPEEALAIPKGTESILFVDDEPILAETGACILRRLGYEVSATTSIHEALRLFQENPHRFALAITDLTMPEMTGDRLAMEMLAIRPDFPVILCTGYSDPAVEEQARAVGIKGFAHKPLSTRKLAQKIRATLDCDAP